MKTSNLGPVHLGNRPMAAAVLGRRISLGDLQKLIKAGCQVFELRVDLFENSFNGVLEYAKEIKEHLKIGLLGTIREGRGKEEERVERYSKLIQCVDAVDVDLNSEFSSTIVENVKKIAPKKPVVVSHHDFERTPGYESLIEIVEKALLIGADIVKIAVTARSKKDVADFLTFSHQIAELCPFIAISMGEEGKISRLISSVFGSLISYGYIDKTVAPGQWEIYSLLDQFKIHFPDQFREGANSR